ncbi:MAG: hypothetical protein JWO03_1811 [Bacteroidetes bacterium]|nr:hypothetical protein [Bacteroidota bacterium]
MRLRCSTYPIIPRVKQYGTERDKKFECIFKLSKYNLMNNTEPANEKESNLFHSTSFDGLKSIIRNGFYPSYAKEIFGGRAERILMVSFSCIPLTEIASQKDYGLYSIGMSMEWGIKNKCHPVLYTYENSDFENGAIDLIEISVAGATLPTMLDIKAKGLKIFANGFLKKMSDLADEKPTRELAQKLEEITNYVFSAANNLNLFSKKYRVKLQSGRDHIAFFDREWRYIPSTGLKGANQLLFKENAYNQADPDYKYWSEQKKPHGQSAPLTFKVEDIKFLVINNNKEAKEIVSLLKTEFDKDRVNQLLIDRQLSVISRQPNIYLKVILCILGWPYNLLVQKLKIRPL